MELTDEVLEIMAEYFQMNQGETNEFIEEVRAFQSEIFWKSFFAYYEANKSKLEFDYLEKIIKDLKESNSGKIPDKLVRIIEAESTHNPEMIEQISSRISTFTVKLLVDFLETTDEDTAEKVFDEVFKDIDLVRQAIDKGIVEPSPAFRKKFGKYYNLKKNEK